MSFDSYDGFLDSFKKFFCFGGMGEGSFDFFGFDSRDSGIGIRINREIQFLGMQIFERIYDGEKFTEIICSFRKKFRVVNCFFALEI